METLIDLIPHLGFPIVCTIGVGYALYTVMKRWMDDASERENSMRGANEKFSEALKRVAETLTESNSINRELSETNRTLVERVEDNLNTLNNNVERILDKLGTENSNNNKK